MAQFPNIGIQGESVDDLKNNIIALNRTLNWIFTNLNEENVIRAKSVIAEWVYAGTVTTDQLIAGEALIGSALIEDLSADKITSGTLTIKDLMEIKNDDGSISMTPTELTINDGKIVIKNHTGEETMINAYGIDPRFLKSFKNMIYNGQFKKADTYDTLIPTYWTGGAQTQDSSFLGSYSMRLEYMKTSHTTGYPINPQWYKNVSDYTRVSFYKKGGAVKVEVYDTDPSDDGRRMTLFNEDETTGASSITFEYNENWTPKRCDLYFAHGTVDSLILKFTNEDEAMYDAYIDGVLLEPDFTRSFASLFFPGPRSDFWGVRYNPDDERYEIWTGVGWIAFKDAAKLGNLKSISATAGPGKITLNWEDPDDELDATWLGTMVRWKADDFPENENDGFHLVTTSIKDTYSVAGYEHKGLDPTLTYYYSIFPFTTDYVFTIHQDNTVSETPEPPAISGDTSLLYAWGPNSYYQLGDGTTKERSSPIQIGVSTWKVVATGGSFSLGIKGDDTLWAWGRNNQGQLGIGSSDTTIELTQVGTSTWKMVKCGILHTLGILSDDTLWAWGSNSYGEVGDGTNNTRNAPVQIGTSTWLIIAAGWHHSLGIRADGTLWSWGNNGSGRLGDGTTTNRNAPVQIGSSTWKAIAAGYFHSLGIRADNTLWAWGSNSEGQLGVGWEEGTPNKLSPIQVGSSTWVAVSCGSQHTMGISGTQTYGWGRNNRGQLGDGTGYTRWVPTFLWAYDIGTVSTIECGNVHTLAIRNSNNTLWAWGYNEDSNLGDGTVISTRYPKLISSASWMYVSASGHNLGILNEVPLDTLWGCGYDGYGQLAQDSASTSRKTLVQIGSSAWNAVAATGSHHTIGIRADNTLWGCGNDWAGQQGQGSTTTGRTWLVEIGTSTWKAVATGSNFTVGIMEDSTLWGCGEDQHGQLGQGSTTLNRSTLIQIGTSTWKSVACGGTFTVGIRGDHTLWGCGEDTYGMLGQGSTSTSRHTLVQIGTSTWKAVACGVYHTVGIRADDTLWGCGYDQTGELGQGSTSEGRLTLVQIGTSTWKAVACGSSFTLGIRGDNTLWGCGRDAYGQLGQGSTADERLTLVQIGSSTWKSIAAGADFTVGIRADNTLWGCGEDTYGQLGQGSTTARRSSMVRISSSTWKAVTAGFYHTIGILDGG